MTDFTLTGRHVALIFGSAFTVIIGVNLTLATQAIKTFPGLETRNAYVSSQTFDADREAQLALGWTVEATVQGGELVLQITGANGPVAPEITEAVLGRATHTGEDQQPQFTYTNGAYRASVGVLARGNWNLRLKATAADGTQFQQRIPILVRS